MDELGTKNLKPGTGTFSELPSTTDQDRTPRTKGSSETFEFGKKTKTGLLELNAAKVANQVPDLAKELD